MRLNDLRGATSVRLAMLFAGMFGTASLVFAATIFLMTARFLAGNPDERMRAEALGFDSRPKRDALRLLDQHSVDDATGRRPFGLFDAAGRHLAGNLPRLPEPRPAAETVFETDVRTARGDTVYRSIIHELPNGNVVVVSRNIEELARFRATLLDSTLAGLALMTLLGVGGGALIGVGSLRRLDRLTAAIERITRGDLAGRLPTRGSGDDVDRLVRVVNSMLDQIERLMGEVKGVCDSIAHDLRTPLTRLLGGLERAARRDLTASAQAELEGAIDEVQAMLRTFDALLRISEVGDGARRTAFRTVDLGLVVADAVEHYEPAADVRGLAIVLAPAGRPDAPVHLQGDPDLLFEAVANLLDNAIKFTPAGGTILVEVGAGPRLVVADNGRGIAPADRQQVTLRFRRGAGTAATPGSGLGLPLVEAIATLHGLVLSIEDGAPGCRVVLAPQPVPANQPRRATAH